MNIEIYFFLKSSNTLLYKSTVYNAGHPNPYFSEKEIENPPKLLAFKMSCSSDPFRATIGPSKVKPANNPSIWEADIS